eukprot:11876595-Alexandrium_andersonii.AAC.1
METTKRQHEHVGHEREAADCRWRRRGPPKVGVAEDAREEQLLAVLEGRRPEKEDGDQRYPEWLVERV